MGLFDKLKESLTRTRKGIAEGIESVVRRGKVDEETLEELEELLLRADVGVRTTEDLLATLRERAQQKRLEDADAVRGALREAVLEILQRVERGDARGTGVTTEGTEHATARDAVAERAAAIRGDVNQRATETVGPRVLLIMGVNGVGKTTSIGKLAYKYASAGRSVLVAASDTFRAAAADQLMAWADRAGVQIVRHKQGSDPASVAYDAVTAAKARGVNVVLVDTAGRLHTKVNLMEELKKVRRVIGREMPGAPHESLLVLDATTGQNALAQAREFAQHVGVTGLVLAKIDGTAKGGIVVAIARELNLPVRYLGVGEAIDDLVEFDPREFAEALFAAPSEVAG
jgi:fused signal recognition particle receptor